MSEINQAKKQLQQALAKLDDVVKSRSSDGEAQQDQIEAEAKADAQTQIAEMTGAACCATVVPLGF